MENKGLYVVPDKSDYLVPATTVAEAMSRYQAMRDFVSGILKKDVDYGLIPGSEKPSLWKPGAEKLASFFGIHPTFSVNARIDDWNGSEHGDEPFFLRDYKCSLFRNGELIGEGCGSCNSWETKYRFRTANRVCPKCGKETIIKGRDEFGGGWLCYVKKGGCGAKFKNDDKSIIEQVVGKIKNTEIYDQVNTIDKMAQKRAFIAAVLIAVNASDYFTQDLEDFIPADHAEVIEGEFSYAEQPKVTRQSAEPAPDVPLDNIPEMPLELAASEMNSKGQRYGDLTTDTLKFMYKALSGKPRTEDIERKMVAIQTILKLRSSSAA